MYTILKYINGEIYKHKNYEHIAENIIFLPKDDFTIDLIPA